MAGPGVQGAVRCCAGGNAGPSTAGAKTRESGEQVPAERTAEVWSVRQAYSGQGAKSGQFAYYICGTLFREGAGTCSARYLNAPRVEEFVVENMDERQSTQKITILVGGGVGCACIDSNRGLPICGQDRYSLGWCRTGQGLNDKKAAHMDGSGDSAPGHNGAPSGSPVAGLGLTPGRTPGSGQQEKPTHLGRQGGVSALRRLGPPPAVEGRRASWGVPIASKHFSRRPTGETNTTESRMEASSETE